MVHLKTGRGLEVGMRLFRVEHPRMGLAKEQSHEGPCLPLGLFSKCNGNPLKVRSREWCELIDVVRP